MTPSKSCVTDASVDCSATCRGVRAGIRGFFRYQLIGKYGELGLVCSGFQVRFIYGQSRNRVFPAQRGHLAKDAFVTSPALSAKKRDAVEAIGVLGDVAANCRRQAHVPDGRAQNHQIVVCGVLLRRLD